MAKTMLIPEGPVGHLPVIHHKGLLCGIMAAVCYGTNPLGALPLYAEGVNTSSVLFYRFSLAAAMLGLLLLVERKSFRVSRHELHILSLLGLLFSASSITYYQSFHFMDAGIASTILFAYPVMVAVIMALRYHEKLQVSTVVAILLSLVGIGLLYQGDGSSSLSLSGVILVLLSALSYALYIVVVRQSDLHMSSLKLTFYVLLFCALVLLLYSFIAPHESLQIPPSPRAWFFAGWLGLVPTVLSLVFMAVAVREIGATPTAILGALEPLTAVAIGVLCFHEALTWRLTLGIVVILTAVLLVVARRKTNT